MCVLVRLSQNFPNIGAIQHVLVRLSQNFPTSEPHNMCWLYCLKIFQHRSHSTCASYTVPKFSKVRSIQHVLVRLFQSFQIAEQLIMCWLDCPKFSNIGATQQVFARLSQIFKHRNHSTCVC